MNEGLRLKTPHELLEGLKAQGYSFFELDDYFYQYIDKTLYLVFDPSESEHILTIHKEDMKTVPIPEGYLNFKGVTNDYVAFFIAKKGTMILMDGDGIVIKVTRGSEFGNRPSDYRNVTNLLVEYLKPGYIDEFDQHRMDLMMDDTPRGLVRQSFRKVFHDGQFFYEGYENTSIEKFYTFEIEVLSTVVNPGSYSSYFDEDNERLEYDKVTSKKFDTPERAIVAGLKEVRSAFDKASKLPGVKYMLAETYIRKFRVIENSWTCMMRTDGAEEPTRKNHLTMTSFTRHIDGVDTGSIYAYEIEESFKKFLREEMIKNGFELQVMFDYLKKEGPEFAKLLKERQIVDIGHPETKRLPVGMMDRKDNPFQELFDYEFGRLLKVPFSYGRDHIPFGSEPDEFVWDDDEPF